MSDAQSLQSWSELYAMLRGLAEQHRGTVTIAPTDGPSATFPLTTSRDVFTIALVFDSAADDHVTGALGERWIAEADLLAGEPEDSLDAYVGNRSLWATLADVAAELDRVRAPLPSLSLINDAIAALESPRPAAAERRNASAPGVVTVLGAPSWSAMALRQFEFFRALRGEESAGFMSVPCTLNADVVALAEYWTDQLARIGSTARETIHRLTYSSWRDAVRDVVRHARQAGPYDRYPCNVEFWAALLTLATRSDACQMAPHPWAFCVPPPPPSYAAVRNAGDGFIEFPATKSWDDQARMQRDKLAELRGADQVADRLIARVPRTTVSDVRQVADYWRKALAKVGDKSFADISARRVLERWRAALADVDMLPADTNPDAVYARNLEFWEAVITIGIQIAVTAEAPTRWQLAKAATKHVVTNFPETLANLPQTLRSFWSEYLVNWLKRPIVYAGFGLGGIVLTAYLLRGSGQRS